MRQISVRWRQDSLQHTEKTTRLLQLLVPGETVFANLKHFTLFNSVFFMSSVDMSSRSGVFFTCGCTYNTLCQPWQYSLHTSIDTILR